MNKIKSVFAIALLSSSLGIAFAEESKSSKSATEAESKQTVEPHSHPRDAKGVNAQPEQEKNQKKSKKADEKKHFHPRDGK